MKIEFEREHYFEVSRVEVIGADREFVKYLRRPGVMLEIQDDGRTLKIFLDED